MGFGARGETAFRAEQVSGVRQPPEQRGWAPGDSGRGPGSQPLFPPPGLQGNCSFIHGQADRHRKQPRVKCLLSGSQFLTRQAILGYQLGVPEFNSVLVLCTQR